MVVLVGAIFDIVKKILRLYFGIPNGIRWHAYKQHFITTLINEYFKYMGGYERRRKHLRNLRQLMKIKNKVGPLNFCIPIFY